MSQRLLLQLGGHGTFRGYSGTVCGKILPRIVAITGQSSDKQDIEKCGKKLICNYLQNKYLYKKMQFTDPLETAMRNLFIRNEYDLIRTIAPIMLPYMDKQKLAQTFVSKLQNDNMYVIPDLKYMYQYEELRKTDPFIICVDRADGVCKDYEYKDMPFDMYIEYDEKNVPLFMKNFDNNFSNL
jgi:hypothetical protein